MFYRGRGYINTANHQRVLEGEGLQKYKQSPACSGGGVRPTDHISSVRYRGNVIVHRQQAGHMNTKEQEVEGYLPVDGGVVDVCFLGPFLPELWVIQRNVRPVLRGHKTGLETREVGLLTQCTRYIYNTTHTLHLHTRYTI